METARKIEIQNVIGASALSHNQVLNLNISIVSYHNLQSCYLAQ